MKQSKKLFFLCAMVVCMAVLIVLGIAHLRRSAGEEKKERQLSTQCASLLLTGLPSEHVSGAQEMLAEIEAEYGYLPYDISLQKLAAYAKENAPGTGLGYHTYDVISVSGNSLYVTDETEAVCSLTLALYDDAGEDTAGKSEPEATDFQNSEPEATDSGILAAENGSVYSKSIQTASRITYFGTYQTAFLLEKVTDSEVTLPKAWIMANGGADLTFRYRDIVFTLPAQTEYNSYEDIADLVLFGGKIREIKPYRTKVNAKLLCIRDGKIELESGIYPYADDIQVYKLFGNYEPYTLSDLKIGYDFTDFVLDTDGRIIAALVTKEAEMDKIRVVIKTTEFASAYHESVTFSCDTGFVMKSGENVSVCSGGEEITLDAESDLFAASRITVIPDALTSRITLSSVTRNQGKPSYRGTMEFEKTEDGILIINELPLDEYLYSVVPSEMPSSYPLEALKSQAVSARTYAYAHMLHSGLQKYGAHVDDSAAFQVYNNIMESDTTTRAVRETQGQIVTKDGAAVTTYFYSTSCGYGTDLTAWEAAPAAYLKAGKIGSGDALDLTQEDTFQQFIKTVDSSCYESGETYFRWKYETKLQEELLLETLKNRQKLNPDQILTWDGETFSEKEIKKLGRISKIEVVKRAEGGAVSELVITGEKATVKVLSEKNVRYVLANENETILLGAEYTKEGACRGMLPSAFLYIEPIRETEDTFMSGYRIYGGGFGHGIGMSQNGAKAMAACGMDYAAILQFFYEGTELTDVADKDRKGEA